MKLQTIVYVSQMDRSVEWYTSLLDSDPQVASEHWTSFRVGDANLALHFSASDGEGRAGDVELSLVASEPLEVIIRRVGAAGPIVQQPFGRSVDVADPDGLRIQVNEHDPQRYQS